MRRQLMYVSRKGKARKSLGGWKSVDQTHSQSHPHSLLPHPRALTCFSHTPTPCAHPRTLSHTHSLLTHFLTPSLPSHLAHSLLAHSLAHSHPLTSSHTLTVSQSHTLTMILGGGVGVGCYACSERFETKQDMFSHFRQVQHPLYATFKVRNEIFPATRDTDDLEFKCRCGKLSTPYRGSLQRHAASCKSRFACPLPKDLESLWSKFDRPDPSSSRGAWGRGEPAGTSHIHAWSMEKREKAMDERERAMTERERMMIERERAMIERERMMTERETALNTLVGRLDQTLGRFGQ